MRSCLNGSDLTCNILQAVACELKQAKPRVLMGLRSCGSCVLEELKLCTAKPRRGAQECCARRRIVLILVVPPSVTPRGISL
jgi:hypothetical protein